MGRKRDREEVEKRKRMLNNDSMEREGEGE